MATPPSTTARACPEYRETLPSNGSTSASGEVDPAVHNRRRLWLGAAGTVLTLSGVFAPVGLPLLWAAHRHRQLASGGDREPRSLPGHLLAVGRRQFELDRPREEFTRGGSRAVSLTGRPPEI